MEGIHREHPPPRSREREGPPRPPRPIGRECPPRPPPRARGRCVEVSHEQSVVDEVAIVGEVRACGPAA